MEGNTRLRLRLRLRLLLLHFLLLLLCVIPAIVSSASAKNRATLTRVDHTEIAASSTDRFRCAVQRSNRRVKKLEAEMKKLADDVETRHTGTEDDAIVTPVIIGGGEYLMEVAVVSPGVTFQGIADTGSDLIWTQCLPCKNSCFKQSTPVFDPSKSSTYSTVPCADSLCSALGEFKTGCTPECNYMYNYADGSTTAGLLSCDTLTIGGVVAGRVAFGCAHESDGAGYEGGGGLVGLGRGPLSLLSQLGDKLNNKFSYCLLDRFRDPPNATSPMFFGDSANLNGVAAQTLTLQKTGPVSSFWYLPVTGISVAGNLVAIPGRMIIDSGTTVTYLAKEAYTPVAESVKSAVLHLPLVEAASTGLDVCFNVSAGVPNLSLPSLAFKFEGGVDMELPPNNSFIEFDGGILCLAFLENDDDDDSISILGNTQQQNFHILYDNGDNTLSFNPEKCASL